MDKHDLAFALREQFIKNGNLSKEKGNSMNDEKILFFANKCGCCDERIIAQPLFDQIVCRSLDLNHYWVLYNSFKGY
jgi:hypothetical protein